MKKFTIPTNLNGAELIDELIQAGVNLPEEKGAYKNVKPPMIMDGFLWLDVNNSDESLTKQIVEAHDGDTTEKEPSVSDKLASVGLSLDDLKTALGI